MDERFYATEEEKLKVLSNYFKNGFDGPLQTFPSKEKRKIIVIQHILKRFDQNKQYSEKEINETIKEVYHDFATIRRCMIDYGFLQRSKDGRIYWMKNGVNE